jgi:hypothetical protein
LILTTGINETRRRRRKKIKINKYKELYNELFGEN